jgi:hypothetical protein
MGALIDFKHGVLSTSLWIGGCLLALLRKPTESREAAMRLPIKHSKFAPQLKTLTLYISEVSSYSHDQTRHAISARDETIQALIIGRRIETESGATQATDCQYQIVG